MAEALGAEAGAGTADGTANATMAKAAEPMITVRYFAGARAASGIDEERLPARPALRVGELAEELGRRHGADLVRVLEASSFLVDEVAATAERPVPAGAVVDVLPPFAGG